MTYVHNLLFFETISPLHVGCGQDIGVVDLPVIRERTTGFPFIPGSGIRGACRAACPDPDKQGIGKAHLFGPEADEWEAEATRYAGCLAFHDAKVLLYPVRSDRAPFLWITCPMVLRRLARELRAYDVGLDSLIFEHETVLGDDEAATAVELADGGELYLEELVFRESDRERDALAAWARNLAELAEIEGLENRLVLVSDASFTHFVRFATLIQQHNKLTPEKTVEGGQLFSLEAVPPEALFYGYLGATASRWPKPVAEEAKIPEKMAPAAVLEETWGRLADRDKQSRPTASRLLHLGGHESTGLGLTRLRRVEASSHA